MHFLERMAYNSRKSFRAYVLLWRNTDATIIYVPPTWRRMGVL